MTTKIKLLEDKIKSIITKRNLYYLAISVYLAINLVSFINDCLNARGKVTEQIDKRLEMGVAAANQIVGKSYHDEIAGKLTMPEEDVMKLTVRLSEFADTMGLKYVYTMIKRENKVYFTASSSTKDEFENGDWNVYMEEYPEATPELINMFKNEGGTLTEVASDSYGNFRSYLVNKVTPNGIIYVVGADMSVGDINMIIFKNFLFSLLRMIFYLLILIPFIYLFSVLNSKEKEILYHQITYDRITALPKRERFLSDVEKADIATVFLINIDYLKDINEFYGYSAGDCILKSIADRITNVKIKFESITYKISSDEFLVMIKNEMKKDEVEILARYFFEVITELSYFYENREIYINSSIGVYSFTSESTEFDRLRMGSIIVTNANNALEKAKELNKPYVVYDDTMKENIEYEKNLHWAKKIKEAILEDRVIPFFQPIINNNTGNIEKYESLIRIVDRDNKIISPFLFLGPSRKYKLYSYLTKIMITKAFQRFEKEKVEFSINLSVEDILDDSTYDFVMYNLQDYANAGRVVFELLETEGIENYEKVIEFIKDVKSYGCKIAIDDFGSGYSNFEHILKLDVDYLKIDASLIKSIDKDKNSEIITSTIANFSKNIGIKTIAEFVHSKDVYEKVKLIGVDFSQGFYLGEPRADLVLSKII